jgi:ADP-ribose pyrophosphatase YjhB (NUDIX family)
MSSAANNKEGPHTGGPPQEVRIRPLHGVLLVLRQKGNLVLIRREKEPYKGLLALPGGKIEKGETPLEAARREMREETGLRKPAPAWIGRVTDLLVEGEPPHMMFVLDIFEATLAEEAHSQPSFEGSVMRLPLADLQKRSAEIIPADILILWRLAVERSTTMLDLVTTKTGDRYDVRAL